MLAVLLISTRMFWKNEGERKRVGTQGILLNSMFGQVPKSPPSILPRNTLYTFRDLLVPFYSEIIVLIDIQILTGNHFLLVTHMTSLWFTEFIKHSGS